MPGAGSSVFQSSAVSVGYWRFHTSRAIALVPNRRSSGPTASGTPTVSCSGAAAPADLGAPTRPNATAKIPTRHAPIDTAAAVLRTSPPSAARAVAHDLARRVESGDTGDATAAVRRAARLVQPRDRRAEVGVPGRGSHVEELVGGELAVEDVAADQAVLVLHLERPDHLPVEDRVPKTGRDRVDAVDDTVG